MSRKIITTEETEEDKKIEGTLRPRYLKEYIGQEKIKSTLKIFIDAAKTRGEALDHVLFYGPPGLGKTTLCGIIANEMGVNLKVTSGPAIEKPGEMAAILNNLQEGDVLFVDEIHRLNRQVEEVLYPAMEDFAIDIMLGKDSAARSIRLELPRFTLVGATTRAGLLTAPLRDRFGVIQRLEFYSPEELCVIVKRSAKVMGVEIQGGGSLGDRKKIQGHPQTGKPASEAGQGFCPGKIRRRHHKGCGGFCAGYPGCGPAGTGQQRPDDPPHHDPEIRRRPRGTGDPGGVHRRGFRDSGGCI